MLICLTARTLLFSMQCYIGIDLPSLRQQRCNKYLRHYIAGVANNGAIVSAKLAEGPELLAKNGCNTDGVHKSGIGEMQIVVVGQLLGVSHSAA